MAATVVNNLVKDKRMSTFLGMNTNIARIVIPAGMALTVFSLGQFISWGSKRCSKRQKLNMTKSVIETWVTQIKESIDINIEGLSDFTRELTTTKELHPVPLKFTPMLIDKLGELKLLEIQELLSNLKVKKKELKEEEFDGNYNHYKQKIIYNIVSQIEFLSQIMGYIKDEYTKFHEASLLLMEDWNKEYNDFNILLNDIGGFLSRKEEELKETVNFWRVKDQIVNDFLSKHNDSHATLDHVFEDLLNPISKEFNEFLCRTPYKNEVIKLGYSIQNLFIIKMKWDAHKIGHAQLAQTRCNSIKSSYKTLVEDVNKIERRRLIRWWRIK